MEEKDMESPQIPDVDVPSSNELNPDIPESLIYFITKIFIHPGDSDKQLKVKLIIHNYLVKIRDGIVDVVSSDIGDMNQFSKNSILFAEAICSMIDDIVQVLSDEEIETIAGGIPNEPCWDISNKRAKVTIYSCYMIPFLIALTLTGNLNEKEKIYICVGLAIPMIIPIQLRRNVLSGKNDGHILMAEMRGLMNSVGLSS